MGIIECVAEEGNSKTSILDENLFPPLSRAGGNTPAPFNSTVVIREALPSDTEWFVRELEIFSRFNATKYPLFKDAETTRGIVLTLVKDHFVRVAERGGEPVGFIAAYVVRNMFNPDILVQSETFWWVTEAHRQSSAGARLLDAYIEWGRENVQWVSFALQAHSPVKIETMTKRGFKLHELYFLMEID